MHATFGLVTCLKPGTGARERETWLHDNQQWLDTFVGVGKLPGNDRCRFGRECFRQVRRILDEDEITASSRLDAGDTDYGYVAIPNQRCTEEFRDILERAFHCILYSSRAPGKESSVPIRRESLESGHATEALLADRIRA